ncbi:alpha/beta hydrolase [Micromonospora yangpuensis]|nr:alpha/beta hydrolase [Micromonospora yangpuensis]
MSDRDRRDQEVRWHPSEDPRLPDLEVATVAVPLDHDDVDGRQIDIGLARHRATDPAARLGVLLVCPDDPGNRGTVLLPRLRQSLPDDVLTHFDLVGFDHRFSGSSTPLTAGLSQEDCYWAFHHPVSFEQEVEFQRDLVARCFRAVGPMLPYITTRNIARDIDVLRSALGEERISLLGHSYGSYIAAVYSQLFGRHADRLVLDSVIDPAWVWQGLFTNVAEGAQHGLGRWARWVATEGAALGLGGTSAEVIGYVERLLTEARARPPRLGPITLDEGMLRMTIVIMLSDDATYGPLAVLLRAAAGDAPLDDGTQAMFGAMFGQPREESGAIAQLAILGGEARWSRDLNSYRAAVKADAERLPLVGATMAMPKAGTFWPVDPTEPPTEIGPGNVAPGLLLVQSEHDPFTPASGARHLRELLPDNSRLVVAAGVAAHRLFPFHGHPAVDGVVRDYLLTGDLPPADSTVGADHTAPTEEDS